MEVILSDLQSAAESIFLSGDWTVLAMVAVAALIGVAAMRNLGQILCASVLAMILLGVIWLVYGGVTSDAPSDPATWMSRLDAGWTSISEMPGTTLVGYLVTFAVSIGVLFLGKSVIFRG